MHALNRERQRQMWSIVSDQEFAKGYVDALRVSCTTRNESGNEMKTVIPVMLIVMSVNRLDECYISVMLIIGIVISVIPIIRLCLLIVS